MKIIQILIRIITQIDLELIEIVIILMNNFIFNILFLNIFYSIIISPILASRQTTSIFFSFFL